MAITTYNWRDNCIHCPFFEDCKSSKSEEECSDFLNKEMIKSFKKWEIIASISKPTLIFVYEKTDFLSPGSNEKVVYFSTIYSSGKKEFIRIDETDYGMGSEEDCRKATYNEISEFKEALTKESVSNPKARKVLKEVFNKEVETVIRTYQDLIDNNKIISGYFISSADSKIIKYGGAITDEEWKDGSTTKYTISRFKYTLEGLSFNTYYFLAFHTKEQRDNFLKYNEQLVKDYLMINMEKIPCIKYNSQDWDYIESNLIKFGYEISQLTSWEVSPYIVFNLGNNLGRVSNIDKIAVLKDSYNREIVYNVEKFLERAAHLKGRNYVKRNVMKIHDIEIKPGIYVDERIAENLYVVIPTKRGLGVVAYGAPFTWDILDNFLEMYSGRVVAICIYI